MIGWVFLGILLALGGRVVFWAERQRWEERYQGGHRMPSRFAERIDALERWITDRLEP